MQSILDLTLITAPRAPQPCVCQNLWQYWPLPKCTPCAVYASYYICWALCLTLDRMTVLGACAEVHTCVRAQFTTYVQRGMLSDLVCYYYPSERRIVFVVQLGRRARSWRSLRGR